MLKFARLVELGSSLFGARAGVWGAAALVVAGLCAGTQAQEVAGSGSSLVSSSADGSGWDAGNLPEAPVAASAGEGAGQARGTVRMAGPLDDTIDTGETAPRLRVGDKILMGMRSSVTPFAALGWVVSAGYEQATNGSPNYGQTGKGFAQRLGAAAARDSSETIFSTSVMAPILHEDPRYYRMGAGHNVIHRAFYAATRTLVTRTDGGRTTANFAFLTGNLEGSALTQLYYPPGNRNLGEVLSTFGGSIGGSALGNLVTEFIGGSGSILHLKKD